CVCVCVCVQDRESLCVRVVLCVRWNRWELGGFWSLLEGSWWVLSQRRELPRKRIQRWWFLRKRIERWWLLRKRIERWWLLRKKIERRWFLRKRIERRWKDGKCW